ncbi:YcnI family protein [Catellatospora tritici]|uniref:YcnI family protein n=1 Tax=Catellatospora tritici TaxID=2851566 RepID=UPI001C2D9B63|nr:YcnI family protein [Catellatospora tritici]MBV1856704.1 YcnI family protein [Catellatospora tritici]
MPSRPTFVSRLLVRATVVASAAAAAVLLHGSPSAAHVTVTPSTATAGGYGTFSFKVPNERPTASTTRLEVVFPADHPVTGVSVRPMPGWTITVNRQPGATATPTGGEPAAAQPVTSIIWQDSAIGPGEFQTFDISVGPLPKSTTTLMFKALQTYSDGEVVRWIDPPAAAGAPRPEHPAPAVTVATSAGPAAAVADPVGRVLGWTGVGLGLLALLLAVAPLRRRGGPVPSSSADSGSGGPAQVNGRRLAVPAGAKSRAGQS